jgi:hypothetical protein
MKPTLSVTILVSLAAMAALAWWLHGSDPTLVEAPPARADSQTESPSGAAPVASSEVLEATADELQRVSVGPKAGQRATPEFRELAIQVECPTEPSLVGGLAVRAWVDDEEVADAFVDDRGNGRLTLPLEPTPIAYSASPLGSNAIRIELGTPEGFEVEALGGVSEESQEIALARFRLNPIRRGSLTFALRDASTGEAIPEAEVVVAAQQGESQRLTSTREGLLELEGEQEPGLFSVSVEQPGKSPFPLLNAPQSLEAAAEHFEASEPLSATFSVGPTYRFRVDVPALDGEAPTLRASLIAGGENGVAPVVVWGEVPVRVQDPLGDPTAWVRMPGIAAPADLPRPWTLLVQPESEDSDLIGRGAVAQLMGVQDELVELEWVEEPVEKLAGVVLDDAGNPIPGALVLLFGAGQNPMGKPRDLVVADLAGAFEFSPPNLEVVMITARAKGFEADQLTVGLSSMPDVLTLELATRPIAGRVSGSILGGETWRRLESLVMLRETTFPFHTYTATPQENAEQQVRFEFEAVPQGDYEVWVDGLSGQSFSPSKLSVTAPAVDLEFEMNPPPVLAGLDIDVTAGSGAGRPSRVDVQLFQDGFETRSLLQVQNPSELGPVAVLRDGATWIVGAAGFQPAFGTLASLPESGEARKRLAIKLSPGWGRIVHVTDGEHPIAGVRFVSGGETIGESDASGWARVSAKVKPEKISLKTDGYVLPDGGLVLGDHLEAVGPGHDVHLELRRLY